MTIKKAILLLFILSLLCGWGKALAASGEIASVPTNYEMVEAPTAYVLMHGGYDLLTRVYDNGGVYISGNLGLKDIFMLGLSVNGANVIGNGEIQIQMPQLALKIKALDERSAPFSLAVAWDNRGYGTQSNGVFYPGTQKGFYIACSREFPEAGYLQAHWGVNVVTFNNFDSSQDLGAFLGTSFAISPNLLFNLETDKILNDSWQFNGNFLFNVDKPLRIGIDFRDINRGDLFSRIIRIQYTGFF